MAGADGHHLDPGHTPSALYRRPDEGVLLAGSGRVPLCAPISCPVVDDFVARRLGSAEDVCGRREQR